MFAVLHGHGVRMGMLGVSYDLGVLAPREIPCLLNPSHQIPTRALALVRWARGEDAKSGWKVVSFQVDLCPFVNLFTQVNR